ncbi:MAG: S8 family serine peptidase [Candidatus Zixiibacteriota bacterium]
MKKERLAFLMWLVLTGALLLHPDAADCLYSARGESALPEFAPDRLIIKLKPEADERISLQKVRGKVVTGLAALDSLHHRFDVKEQEKLFAEFRLTALRSDKFSSVYLLQVPDGTDLIEMKSEYEGRPEVEYAELDCMFQLFEEPNDPLFSHQWYLNNTGQGYLGVNRIPGNYNDTQVIRYGTGDADIDALEAFERDDERTVPLVGIIDTGLDLDHPDLANHVWTNPGEIPDNGRDDDHNGFVDDFYGWDFSGNTAESIEEDNDPTDYYGHGTHCAGIVAGAGDNGIGISGVSTPCKIMAIKSFPNALFSLSAKSIVYAADMGCDVINMSWGGPLPSRVIEDALDYAVDRGVLPIAAAGNSGGEDRFYPASLPQAFSVGASNSDDEVTHFSTYGDHIEVVAPGEDILSLRADNTDMYAQGGASGIEPNVYIVNSAYYLCNGTSMASPCAVGVAAYILAASPGISNQRVKAIIEQSADDIIFPYGGDSLYSPGKDIYSGHGRVNLNSALQLLSGRLAKIDYPYENAVVSGDVAIHGTASGDNFENYVLEYGEGISPGDWIEIRSANTPVSKDTLGIWNASGLTGFFTLRLTVGDQNQATVHVIAANQTYVKITSPVQGDTIRGYAEIYGYTITPDFSRYTLEYGYGESPSHWFPIATSTRMIADWVLGNWLVSFLGEMDYSIRLSVETDQGQTYADTVRVTVQSIASAGWVQELSAVGSLSPAVGDIDGDGYNEIVVGIGGPAGFGTRGGAEVFDHRGKREDDWHKDIDKDMKSSPAVADLDADGIEDIVICSDQGMHAYLSGSKEWFRPCHTGGNEFWGLATPVVADLENDGHPEVLTINDRGEVYAWRGDGESVIFGAGGVFARTAGSAGDVDFPCLAVADLDKDGENEVICGAAHPTSGEFGHYEGVGGIYVWDAQGEPLLEPGDYPHLFVHVFGIAIADVDGVQDLEIVVFGMNQDSYVVSALKKDGTLPSGYPVVLEGLIAGWWFGNHPAVGDLEGDGTLEIVVSLWTLGEACIYAWHQDGSPLGREEILVVAKTPDAETQRGVLSALGSDIGEIATKIKNMEGSELTALFTTSADTVFASVSETFGSPVLTDVDGDGAADIIARAGYFLGTGFERVFAWDWKGDLIGGFPLYASAVSNLATFSPYTPVMADVDGDGKLDMVLVTDYTIYDGSKLILWEFDQAHNTGTAPWPKYMHDSWNSGRHGFNPHDPEIANSPPRDLYARSWNDSSVTLAWTPKPPGTSIGYNIYRADESGRPGARINPHTIPQPDSEYLDLGLAPGQYYYTATNVDPEHEESDRSPELKVALGQPQSVTGLAAELRHGCSVLVSWRPNPEGDIVKYKIYDAVGWYDSDFDVVDSVSAPETTWVDAAISDTLKHGYGVTAVDSLGLEGPMSRNRAWVHAGIPVWPAWLEVLEFTDVSVTLRCHTNSWNTEDIIGCNFYRSSASGDYSGLKPINHTPVPYDSSDMASFTDFDLTEGARYYYTATNVNGCHLESEPFPQEYPGQWLQDSVVVGRPHPPLIKVRSGKKNVKLHISASDTDIEGYKVFRKESDEAFRVLDPLHPDTVYTDTNVAAGVDYHYRVAAIDTFSLEGEPSSEVEGCLMLFDQGMLVVDMTRGADVTDGVNGDSIDAFYQRALEAFDYSYVQRHDWFPTKLLELSHHPITIIHSLDERSGGGVGITDAFGMLEQYLSAGGALLVEGRKNLLRNEWNWREQEFWQFAPGDFRLDCLGIDSAYIPSDQQRGRKAEEFTGAQVTSHVDGYPQMVDLDTFRVNHACDPYGYVPEGKLPGVGYFWPSDSSEVIYTFVSAYDSSASNGKAVALRHFTEGFALIYFDFPLYFAKEDIATQILHQAISDLEEFVKQHQDPAATTWDLTEASVFPNPFKPYQGHTHMTFDGLTTYARIEIFTIAGERVRTLEEADGDGMTSWDVTNSQGRKLASGVYIYRVTDNQGHEKISKFAVIH